MICRENFPSTMHLLSPLLHFFPFHPSLRTVCWTQCHSVLLVLLIAECTAAVFVVIADYAFIHTSNTTCVIDIPLKIHHKASFLGLSNILLILDSRKSWECTVLPTGSVSETRVRCWVGQGFHFWLFQKQCGKNEATHCVITIIREYIIIPTGTSTWVLF